MTIWGVDLGVRSFHAAGLHGQDLTLSECVLATPKKVSAQGPWERGQELAELARFFRSMLQPWDHVFIEEPPAAGSRNLRTFLKLGQTSGALATAAGMLGASVTFVPVDTWKMTVCGKGGVPKDVVRSVLTERAPGYSAQCQEDQNKVDATCIALFGLERITAGGHAEQLGTGRPGHRPAR